MHRSRWLLLAWSSPATAGWLRWNTHREYTTSLPLETGTRLPDSAVRGSTPKPTSTPSFVSGRPEAALELLLRRDGSSAVIISTWENSNTCGWFSGTSSAPLTCDPGFSCSTNSNNVVACVSGTFTPFFTACFNYDASQNGECTSIGASTGCCGDPTYSACGTYLWTGSPGRSMYHCLTQATVVTMIDEPQFVLDAATRTTPPSSSSSLSTPATNGNNSSGGAAATTATMPPTGMPPQNGAGVSRTDPGVNVGALVGAVVGAILALVLLILFALLAWRWMRKRKATLAMKMKKSEKSKTATSSSQIQRDIDSPSLSSTPPPLGVGACAHHSHQPHRCYPHEHHQHGPVDYQHCHPLHCRQTPAPQSWTSASPPALVSLGSHGPPPMHTILVPSMIGSAGDSATGQGGPAYLSARPCSCRSVYTSTVQPPSRHAASGCTACGECMLREAQETAHHTMQQQRAPHAVLPAEQGTTPPPPPTYRALYPHAPGAGPPPAGPESEEPCLDPPRSPMPVPPDSKA